MNQLTPRQSQILDYITESVGDRGYPPTLREIGNHVGIRSTNGVNDHLRALERKGWIERNPGKSRAIRLRVVPFPQVGGRCPTCGQEVPE